MLFRSSRLYPARSNSPFALLRDLDVDASELRRGEKAAPFRELSPKKKLFRSSIAMPPRSKKSKKPEPPSGLSGKCKALLRSGAEAVFGDLSGVGFKHLLLQAVNLGEREVWFEWRGVLTDLFFFFFPSTSRPHSPLCSRSLCLSLPLFSTPPGLIITSALMIWKSLILFTGSESPVSFSFFV